MVRTSVCSWRTFPDLRLIHVRRVTTKLVFVRRPPCWNSTARHACLDSLDTSNVSRRGVTRLVEFGLNGVGHINKLKLRRARSVLGLVTTSGGSTIPVFIEAHSAFHPSVGRCIEYRLCFRWGRNGEFCVSLGPVIRTAGMPACCILA